MTPFRYQHAADVADALSLARCLENAQFIAGGTSQADLMKEGVQRPAALVDIFRIGLDEITERESGGLSIGANVRNSVASDHAAIRKRYPAIAEALHAGASQQIRNMASMAGNLLQRTCCPYLRDPAQRCTKRDPGTGCAVVHGFNRLAIFGQTDEGPQSPRTCISVHPSDMAVAMAAHEAVIVVKGGKGERRIAARYAPMLVKVDYDVELAELDMDAAILDAATDAVAKLKAIVSKNRASPLHDTKADRVEASAGRLHLSDDPSREKDYAAILRRAGLPSVAGTADAKPWLERMRYAFYSFDTVFAEVRVDLDTGVIRVARLCGVYDRGRLINFQTVRSQLTGGITFGFDAVLTEEMMFDPNTGLPVTRNLADYHIPACAGTPEITIEVLNVLDPHIGKLGAHGVGEMGINGVLPAIGNAVFNATGRRLRSLPYAPDKMIEAHRHG